MIDNVKSILSFLKKPNCERLQLPLNEKLNILVKLLIISFITAFSLGILISILEHLGFIELDAHAISKMLNEKTKIEVFLLAVIVAPLFEELIFRGPITLFCNKKYFKSLFYAFAILFGFVHLSNYEITTTILIISPVLVAPQIALGLILGYTRIKLGIAYSILLHLLFNATLIIPGLLFMDKAL